MVDEQATQQDLEPQYDKSLLGTVLAEADIEVSEEAILRYSRAIGETTPKYTTPGPDLEGPPGIVTVLETPDRRAQVKFPFAKTSMHGGSALHTYAPIKPGKFHVTVRLKEVFVKTGRSGAMGFVVHENEFTREDGTVVAQITDTNLARP